jgi:hypothetical protein
MPTVELRRLLACHLAEGEGLGAAAGGHLDPAAGA